jgi:hypothetical protein
MYDKPAGDGRPLIRHAYPEWHPTAGPVTHFEPSESRSNSHLQVIGSRYTCFGSATFLRSDLTGYQLRGTDQAQSGQGSYEETSGTA